MSNDSTESDREAGSLDQLLVSLKAEISKSHDYALDINSKIVSMQGSGPQGEGEDPRKEQNSEQHYIARFNKALGDLQKANDMHKANRNNLSALI